MTFFELAEFFNQLEKLSSRNEMTVFLADLFSQLTSQEARIVSYLLLGELNPPYQTTQLALADKSVVSILSELFSVTEESIKKTLKAVGDIGTVVEQTKWAWKSKKLPILDVYDALKEVATISGKGAQSKKGELLKALFEKMSVSEAKYIVRIVVGKLRLGFSDMTILDALSQMLVGDKSAKTKIENAYNLCADIGLIAETAVSKKIKGIEHISVKLGTPIRPASAERLNSPEEIFEKIGPCVAQLKLDGFRLQVHINNDEKQNKIHFFSRHLTDMSDAFPELAHALSTKFTGTQLICEGEAIGYNQATGGFLPFQETAKRKRKYEIEVAAQEYPLKLFLFDLLYYNGESIFTKPHKERRKLLESIFPSRSADDAIQVVEERKIKTAHELEEYFLHAIELGVEGVVVKRPDAAYQAGKRNFNWIKLKRTEQSHLADTIDVVIVGYYSGRGKRAKFGIGALLVAVYNSNTDSFETIAKLGTGLSDEQWIDAKKRCDALEVKSKPKNLSCAKELTPDAWVSPELVCEVYADEITISPIHTAGQTEKVSGYALRFPRFLQYREDKGPTEATSVKEVIELYKGQK